MGGTEVLNAKDATYTEEGYTGDICCKSCHAVISYGHVIPKLTKPSKPSGGTVKPVSPNAGANKNTEADKEKLPFTDVPQTAWYHESVQKAWESGLIDGVTKTQFQPDGTLTVAQTIKLAAALYQMEHEGEVKLPFVVDERAAADLQRPEQTPVEHPCVLILHCFASFPSPRNRR